MAVPKRKKSKMRVRQRRGQIKAAVPGTVKCACGATRLAHRACPACGPRPRRTTNPETN